MFAPVAAMKSPLTLVAVLAVAVPQLAGCFSVAGAVMGSRSKTSEVIPWRQKDGRVVAHQGDHALAGFLLGAVIDAALISALIAADQAASSWTIGPICTDDHICF